MKKTVTILGYLFLALVAGAILVSAFLYWEGKKLDKESKAFADSAVVAIAAHWDLNELRKRASAEFEDAVDYDEIQEYLDSLRPLGKFVSYGGSTGESTITLSPRYGYEITAEYEATVNFEAGYAGIEIMLIKLKGTWQILDFRVSPGTFTEDKTIV